MKLHEIMGGGLLRRIQMTALACAMALVSACTGLTGRLEAESTATDSRAQRLMAEVGKPTAPPSPPRKVIYDDGVWLGSRSMPVEERSALPQGFYEQVNFDRMVADLGEFAERISMRSGVPVRVTSDALEAWNSLAAAGASQPAVSPAAGGSSQSANPVPSNVLGNSAASSPNTSNASSQVRPPVRISFSGGNLKQLLDMVAARFGASWKFDGGSIVFYALETRQFRIHALSGEASLQATVGSTGSNAGSGATGGGTAAMSKSQANFTAQSALWNNIDKALRAQMSTAGKLALSPETGAVVVTDTPYVLSRIERYVAEQNKILTSQVILNVTVLAVTLTDGDTYGIDWGLVYRKASRSYGINTNLDLGGSATRNALSINVLDTASSRVAGSDVVIQALSEQGKVRRETAAALTALNHQPVPVVVARNTAYVASVAQTQILGGGVTTTITPGNFNAGFSMTLLPYIMDDGNLILQFSTELSSLVSLKEFTASAGNSIQLPEIDTRQFMQRVRMGSGQTLVISGFEQTQSNTVRSGVGAAANFPLGGQLQGQGAREIIVIVVTPWVAGK